MKKTIRAFLLALTLIAVLSACTSGGETPTAVSPGETPTNTPQPLPTAAPSDPCANEVYPVRGNARWIYSSAGSPVGPYEFQERINEVQPNGFIVGSALRKAPSAIQWECRPEGLVPLGTPPNNATNILAFQKLTEVAVSNVTGAAIPAVITPGMEWKLSFDVQAKQNLQDGTQAPVTGHIEITYKAKSRESITVPAGAFDAIPVETITVINIVAAKPTGDEKINLSSNYTYWYAPGVGWVKATGSGALGGQEYFETIVLTAYQ
jgi:hypothetical protein